MSFVVEKILLGGLFMRKPENICITYLDESKMVNHTTKEEFYTIVSITALKEKYITSIESKWSELR